MREQPREGKAREIHGQLRLSDEGIHQSLAGGQATEGGEAKRSGYLDWGFVPHKGLLFDFAFGEHEAVSFLSNNRAESSQDQLHRQLRKRRPTPRTALPALL